MPPPAIPKKVEDIIFYYYAKLIIAPSAGLAKNYGFIMDAYKRLKSGEIRMSDYEREIIKAAEDSSACAFCRARQKKCVPVHIVPKTLGVAPGMHNILMACQGCASSKGEKDLMAWWCKDLGKPRDDVPRVPLGMYLKIAYDLNKIKFTLQKPCKALGEVFAAL
jgi:hypothetical protein